MAALLRARDSFAASLFVPSPWRNPPGSLVPHSCFDSAQTYRYMSLFR